MAPQYIPSTCEFKKKKKQLPLFFLLFYIYFFQVQLLLPGGVLELSEVIREFLPLCPIQQEIFPRWVNSQTQCIPQLQSMVDACVRVAFHEKADV